MGYSVETMREVWNDKHGDCVEVGPDRDALGMVEVRYRLDDGVIGARVAFAADGARLVAQATLTCADELDTANGKDDTPK